MIKTTDINNQAGYGNNFYRNDGSRIYIYKDLTTKRWNIEAFSKSYNSEWFSCDHTKKEIVELVNKYINNKNKKQ